MAKTLWIIEAECSKCGEIYNPESLHKDYIKHYECDAKPSKVWKLYSVDGQLSREEVTPRLRFRWRKADLAALVVVGVCIVVIIGMFWNALPIR